MQLQEINSAIKRKAVITEVDRGTILATFEGHTLFSIYYEDIDVYQQVCKQLKAIEFKYEAYNKKQISTHPVENRYVRRLI